MTDRISYIDHAERETKELLPKIRRLVAEGVTPADAINRTVERSASAYLAALKEYGLSSDIPD